MSDEREARGPIVVIIGLGSNLGDRHAHLDAAAAALGSTPDIAVVGASPRYETEALILPGSAPQPRYLNAALRIETRLTPSALLEACLRIEAAEGRVRRERWGARTLDLDLLFALDARGEPILLEAASLTLPHPRLLERDFALRPLLDVAPELAPLLERHRAEGPREGAG